MKRLDILNSNPCEGEENELVHDWMVVVLDYYEEQFNEIRDLLEDHVDFSPILESANRIADKCSEDLY